MSSLPLQTPGEPGSAPPAADAPSAPAMDYSLRRYALEAVEVLTNADSRLVGTFRALVGRPGELTRAYFSADRERYLRPLQVFLFCNVFYFLVQPLIGWNTLTSPLRVHLEATPYAGWAREMVAGELRGRGMAERVYATRFDAMVAAHAKTLVIAMVPVFALLAAACLWRRRRWFVEHLVFATHFIAFLILTLPVVLAVTSAVLRAAVSLGADARAVARMLDGGPSIAISLVFLYLALRRVYGDGRLRAAGGALLLTVCVGLTLTAYRLLLFLTTFWSI